MTGYTRADLYAWCIIGALTALTGLVAARFAATGQGFMLLALLTFAALALIVAWARRRAILEARTARAPGGVS